MPYSGSCHCGAVTFSVAGDLPNEAMTCNCSHCSRKGFVLTFVPADQFIIDSGEEQIAAYQFYKHKITHQLCKTCGTQAFALGQSPQGATRAINLRCVPSVDMDALAITKVDGASF